MLGEPISLCRSMSAWASSNGCVGWTALVRT